MALLTRLFGQPKTDDWFARASEQVAREAAAKRETETRLREGFAFLAEV